MRSCILVAAVALGQLYADGAITWYEPADGVPLSGLESSQACESRGQRLCYYDELCPSGEDTAPVGMPSSHSDYMPFLSTTYGRRWMGGDCRVHEDLYNEDCYVHGCGTGSPCANECCDHGWCTTPGADGCDSASGSFNGYTGSCKGSYACCSEDDSCAVHGLGPEYATVRPDGTPCEPGCECCRADGGCAECDGDHVCEFPFAPIDYGVCTSCDVRFAGDDGLIEHCRNRAGWGFDHDGTNYDNSCPLGDNCTPGYFAAECRDDGHAWRTHNCASCEECPLWDATEATGGRYTCEPGTSPIVVYDWGVYLSEVGECNYDDCVNPPLPQDSGSSSKSGSNSGGASVVIIVVIIVVVGVVVIAAIAAGAYCYVRSKKDEAPPLVEVQVLGTVGAVESGPLKGAPRATPVPSAPPAEVMPPPAPPRSFCSACGAPVQGPFCGQCGARA